MEQKEISHKENRWLATGADLSFDLVKSGDFKDELENVLKDQFYYRNDFLDYDFKLKALFNKPFSTYGEGDETAIVLPDGVIQLEDGYLVKDFERYSEDNMQTAAKRAYNVNEVKRQHKDLGVYVYKPTTMSELIDPENNCTNEYWNTYRAQLWSGVKSQEMNLESYEQYKNLFYKSDTHWNGRGAYIGYSDIIDMINDDYDIGDPKECIGEYECEYEFYGDIGLKMPYYSSTDHLIDFIIDDIGEYDYYQDGTKLDNPLEGKEKYKKYGNYSFADKWEQTDYFMYYYSICYEKVYDFHDESKPNILIFSDSYACANQEAIASHFNKTIYIDLRMDNEKKFSLTEYLDKYDIDIVLVYQVYSDLYFQSFNFINLD